MRILHTSDWHLGQNFYSKSREAEHQAFLDWLLETAQAHLVDAIIVAVMFSIPLAAQLRPHVIQPFCCQFTANWLSSGGTGRKP